MPAARNIFRAFTENPEAARRLFISEAIQAQGRGLAIAVDLMTLGGGSPFSPIAEWLGSFGGTPRPPEDRNDG
jgi:hypothetical protein